MPKELFNQTAKTTLADSDRVAVGIPGMTGANNITVANLLKQTGNWNILTGNITNASLVGGTWSYTHNKNTLLVRMTVFNPSGYQVNINDLFRINNANTVSIEFGGSIDLGNWPYILEYILT